MHGSSSKLLQDQKEARISQEKPSKGSNTGPETEAQPSSPSGRPACQQTLVDTLKPRPGQIRPGGTQGRHQHTRAKQSRL